MSTTPPPTTGGQPARRRRVLPLVTWAAATVLAAGVAWSAVTAVGGERGDGTGLVSAVEVERMLAARAPDGPAPAAPSPSDPPPGASADQPADPQASPVPPVPPAEPEAGPDAGPEGGPDEGPAAGSDAGPAPGPAPGPAAGPAPDPGGERAAADPPAGAEVARTWDVTGGRVGAVCTGATIRLLYATPADGWSVEVEQAGPERLEVELTGEDADSRVRAECVAGTPQMTRGGDDD